MSIFDEEEKKAISNRVSGQPNASPVVAEVAVAQAPPVLPAIVETPAVEEKTKKESSFKMPNLGGLKGLFLPFGNHQNGKDSYFFLPIVLITIAILVGSWEFLRSPILPSVGDVGKQFVNVVLTKDYFDNLMCSLLLIGKTILVSIVISLVLSYISIIPAYSGLPNFVTKLRFIGYVGIAYIFTIILKDSGKIKIGLLVFAIVPYFVTSAMSMIAQIDRQKLDLAWTLKKSRWETWWHVVIIGKMDAVFEIMRQNIAISFMMLTTVEARVYESGVGYMLERENRTANLATIIAILGTLVALGTLLDYFLRKARFSLFPYTQIELKK